MTACPLPRRRVLPALATLCLAAPLRAAAAPPRIAPVMKSLANEFFQTLQQGAQAHQAAHATQYTLIANGIQDETDTVAQIRLVQQMRVEHVDATIIAPADSRALVPVLADAVASGIVVVDIDNRLDAAALREKGLHVPFVSPDGAKPVESAT